MSNVIFTARIHILWQGDVFSSACHSVHMEGVLSQIRALPRTTQSEPEKRAVCSLLECFFV